MTARIHPLLLPLLLAPACVLAQVPPPAATGQIPLPRAIQAQATPNLTLPPTILHAGGGALYDLPDVDDQFAFLGTDGNVYLSNGNSFTSMTPQQFAAQYSYRYSAPMAQLNTTSPTFFQYGMNAPSVCGFTLSVNGTNENSPPYDQPYYTTATVNAGNGACTAQTTIDGYAMPASLTSQQYNNSDSATYAYGTDTASSHAWTFGANYGDLLAGSTSTESESAHAQWIWANTAGFSADPLGLPAWNIGLPTLTAVVTGNGQQLLFCTPEPWSVNVNNPGVPGPSPPQCQPGQHIQCQSGGVGSSSGGTIGGGQTTVDSGNGCAEQNTDASDFAWSLRAMGLVVDTLNNIELRYIQDDHHAFRALILASPDGTLFERRVFNDPLLTIMPTYYTNIWLNQSVGILLMFVDNGSTNTVWALGTSDIIPIGTIPVGVRATTAYIALTAL